MRYLFIGVLFFALQAGATVVNSDVPQIKKALIKAVESSKVTDSLYIQLQAQKTDGALMTAFIGTLEALKAKHSWNPYNKLKYVAVANKTMKQAVDAAPQDMEIRFMRFSIQHYTPAFLGYSKNLEEDRKAIISHYRHKTLASDATLVKNIAKFMIESKRCTAEESTLLKKYI